MKQKDIRLGVKTESPSVPFFTREQAADIIEAAREPFKALFSLAWYTGIRAGELLALTVHDLDFNGKTIRVNKSSDDNRREIRQPKTKAAVALLPMPSALEEALRNYMRVWTPNPKGMLFATRDGLRPRSRDNVVRVGLKPVLRKLGIPTADVGHARIPAWTGDRVGRGERSAVRAAETVKTRGHCDYAARLDARDSRVAARGDGARWAPIVTFKRYVTSFQFQVIESKSIGGSVWKSNPPFDPRRVESPALKAGKVTGPLSPPLLQ